MRTKRIAYIGTLTSMALILSYFERMIPPLVPIPGVKLGLSNIIVLMALYILTNKDAFIIMLTKVFLVGALFSGISGMFYGLLGGVLSFIFMALFKKSGLFSEVGVSIIGGVMFNVGQNIAGVILISNILLLHYLPILMFFGIISGFIIGIITHYVLLHLKSFTKQY